MQPTELLVKETLGLAAYQPKRGNKRSHPFICCPSATMYSSAHNQCNRVRFDPDQSRDLPWSCQVLWNYEPKMLAGMLRFWAVAVSMRDCEP
jgi:hypothetical protein